MLFVDYGSPENVYSRMHLVQTVSDSFSRPDTKEALSEYRPVG